MEQLGKGIVATLIPCGQGNFLWGQMFQANYGVSIFASLVGFLALPELLPFIIQNDALFDYAVEKSAGSLSPRVKWEHLKNYSFELPEMNQQRKLSGISHQFLRHND